MKIIVITFIFMSLFLLISAETMYDTYLDSLETAYSNKDMPSLDRFASILVSADSTRYEGFYYLAYSKYSKNELKSAASLISKSVSIEKKNANCYLHSLILNSISDKAFSTVTGEYMRLFPSDKRFSNLKASYFLQNDNIDSAAFFASKVLISDAYNENALYIMTLYYYRNKKYPEAVSYSEKLLSVNPRDAYRLIAGNVYRKVSSYDKSNELYSTLIGTQYDYPARKYTAENYYSMDKLDSCMTSLMESAKLYPDSSALFMNMLALYGKLPEKSLIDFIANKAESGSIKDEKVLETAGNQFFNESRYDLASYFFIKLLGVNNGYTSKEAVQSFIFSGKNDYASKSLENMKTGEFDSLFLYKYSGINNYKTGNYALAADDFEKAYSFAPSDTDLIYNLMNSFYLARQDARLLSLIDTVRTDFPEFSDRMMRTFFPDKKIQENNEDNTE